MTIHNTADYQVLSPWAETTPLPPRGIQDRLDTLANKTIGLYRNDKRAAEPMLNDIEEKLKQIIPTVSFTRYINPKPNERIIDQEHKADFENWLEGVDGVIALFGD